MVDRRLAWLAGIVLVWRGHPFQLDLATDLSSPGVCEAGDGAPDGGGGDSSATRHNFRPHRPAAGNERADGVRFHRSAAGAGPGSGFRTVGAGAARDRTALYGKMKWAHDNHHGFLWVKRKIATRKGRICAICVWNGFTSKTRASATTRRERWRPTFWVGGFRRQGNAESRRT